MTPLSCVLPKKGPYATTSAGVVQKVDTDDAGKITAVWVEMDTDKKLVKFKPEELTVLK